MSLGRAFRALMCLLCAAVVLINCPGAQSAAAAAPEPEESVRPTEAAQIAAASRRLFDQKPDVDVSAWQYALYGRGMPVTEEPEQTVRIEGVPVDARIAEPLRRMIADARAQGLSVYLSCGYTELSIQQYIFRRCADKYGEIVAQTIVGRPEESEHRSGLCCDITDRYYPEKDSSLEDTELYAWLTRHCSEYGFILRYPDGKKPITGHVYAPWHFRYVGVEAAEFMADNELCLEEFLDLYKYGR